jgi:hypothetical protein
MTPFDDDSGLNDEKRADAPSFPTLESQVDGVVANARISFALTTISRTASRGEWSRAIDALSGLADKLGAWNAPATAWQEVLTAAAWYAVQASKIDLVAVLFETYATRAWSSKTTQAMPFELAGPLELADRRGRFDAGRDLADLIDELFPTCPLGAYASAHFRERKRHIHGDSQDAAHIADTFTKAAKLAETLGMHETKRRAGLRAGALLLRSGVSREQGRQLLRDIDPSELSRPDALWYAVGMAHSPFWLDRVRAADAVTTVVEGDTESRLDTLHAAGYLLDCAPIELQPLEIDRLEGLADELDVTNQRLRLRTHLEGVASAPAARAGEAADIVAQSLGEDATARQRASVAFCRAVADLFDEPSGADRSTGGLDRSAVERIETFYPTAARVLEALEPTVDSNPQRLATSLGELEGHFRKYGHKLTREDLKPIALLWPRLLPLLRDLEADDDVDQTTRSRVVASAKDIATRWIPGAPTPGYGWWSLAANLVACEMHTQAAAAAHRAIDDGESVDGELERRVIASVLDWAVREGTAEEMLEWLEVAERRLG